MISSQRQQAEGHHYPHINNKKIKKHLSIHIYTVKGYTYSIFRYTELIPLLLKYLLCDWSVFINKT